MKKIVFVGGGGFFLELFEYIVSDINNGTLSELEIKGFLSDFEDTDREYCHFLGKVDNYQPNDDDVFVIAIGNVLARKRIFEKLKARGAVFLTYIHPSSQVFHRTLVGEGVIICPNVIINAYAVIEENACINVFSSVGHEAVVGKHSVLSPYTSLSGKSVLGSGCFVGSRVTLFPSVVIGDECTIDAHTVVKSSVENRQILSEKRTFVSLKNRFLR